MVERRTGDTINLLDSAIRTTGGATVSTTLYVLSGIIYAAVTSPAAVGVFFFLTLVISLLLRPIRGVTQALQKIGSERGEPVETYLGVALLFAVGYLLLLGGLGALFWDLLATLTVFRGGLFLPAGLYALSVAAQSIVASLLAAIGYPSVETWLASLASALQLGVLLLFNGAITTATDLILVVAGVQLALLVPVVLIIGVIPGRPTRHALARVWDFAKWSVPDQIFDRLSYNMPVYVLGIVATPAAVGIYETADRFADFGATIAWRLSSPLLTKVSGDASLSTTDFPYLDGAITGGTGVTVVVFGYLVTVHDIVAAIVFPDAQQVFSIAVLLVGAVNILRGFWTLTSHVIEGIGKPDLSFKTKLYGLVVSVPITAIAGTTYGAVAGAVGYAVMNIVILVAVCYFARVVLGSIPVDAMLATKLAASLLVSVLATTGLVSMLTAGGTAPVAITIMAAITAVVTFGSVLFVTAKAMRLAVDRAMTLSTQWLLSRL